MKTLVTEIQAAEDVRAKYAELREEFSKLRNKVDSWEVDSLQRTASIQAVGQLTRLYKKLEKLIGEGCGLDEMTVIDFPGGCLDSEFIYDLVCKWSGLEIEILENEQIKITSTEKVKPTVLVNAEGREEGVLDFPCLFQENEARSQKWQEIYPELVKTECLQRLVAHIMNMPDKIYGIPDEFTLAHFHNGITCNGWFHLGEFGQVYYSHLTLAQAETIIAEMNRYIGGGELKMLRNEGQPTLYPFTIMMIRKATNNSECVFDYEKLCQRYDGVNEELDNILAQIVDNIELLAPETQLKTLVANRRLVFYYHPNAKSSFDVMKRNIAGRTEILLFERVQNKCPGLKVVSMDFLCDTVYTSSPRGCASYTHNDNERIEFECVIDSENAEGFAATMLQLESKVDKIKSQIDIFVDQIVDEIFEKTRHQLAIAEAEDSDDSHTFPYAASVVLNQLKDEQALPNRALCVEIESTVVNLREVLDMEFLQQVAMRVKEKSDNVIVLSTKDFNYKLEF